MNKSPLNSLIYAQKANSPAIYRQSLRDLMQKICLLGLWRGKFFEHAAFYGGTALRMMYGLDRFSEDLDFSLLKPNPDFQLKNYLDFVQNELRAWNISAQVNLSEKSHSKIESAFIKANTLKTLLNMKIPRDVINRLHKDEISKVKFEIDPYPPCSFDTEFKFVLEPIPFSVCTMSPSDLFAGKMHAVLARNWKNRIKGRDWYDLIWFVSNNISLNLSHLEARLKQSGHLENHVILDKELFHNLLIKRINNLDFENAKLDVLPFIPNPASLTNWSRELFEHLAGQIKLK